VRALRGRGGFSKGQRFLCLDTENILDEKVDGSSLFVRSLGQCLSRQSAFSQQKKANTWGFWICARFLESRRKEQERIHKARSHHYLLTFLKKAGALKHVPQRAPRKRNILFSSRFFAISSTGLIVSHRKFFVRTCLKRVSTASSTSFKGRIFQQTFM
jgi:hypothetical protein